MATSNVGDEKDVPGDETRRYQVFAVVRVTLEVDGDSRLAWKETMRFLREATEYWRSLSGGLVLRAEPVTVLQPTDITEDNKEKK